MASSPEGAPLPAARARPVLGVGGVVLEAAPGPGGPRVLLIKRRYPPAEGRRSHPGGRVEGGEPLAAAAAREILEETGLAVEVGALIEVVELVDPAYHFVVLDYLCRRRGGELRAGDDALEAAFVPVGELPARGCTAKVIAVVARALAMERAPG